MTPRGSLPGVFLWKETTVLAANINLYRKAHSLLRAWGYGPYLSEASGAWTRSNSNSMMTPTQVTVHHTGSRSTATSYLLNPRDRAALKVLANYHITRAGKIIFLCAGGASHAGYTHQACFDRIQAGTAPLDRDLEPGADSKTFSPNKRAVGIEVDGAGGSSEWTDLMHRLVIALCAALNIAGGWTPSGNPRVGTHKEHTRRKPGDPWMNSGTMRAEVAAFMRHPVRPNGTPVSEQPAAGSQLKVDGSFGRASWAAMDAYNRLRYHANGDKTTVARFQRVLNYKSQMRGWRTRIAVDGKLGPRTYGLWGALVGLTGVTSLTDELARRTQNALNTKAW